MSDLTKQENQMVDTSMFDGMETGFEQTYGTTFKTPFLKILQALSPELKRNGAERVEGAEEGMFCNTATKKVYDSIERIVLKVEHVLTVWKPNRGGFVGSYSLTKEDEIVAKIDGVKKFDADGNSVLDTINFYMVDPKNPLDISIMSMMVIQLKHAKTFAQKIRMLECNGTPLKVSFAGVWNLKTVEESNDKGSWYTIGNTPNLVRFISKEELENVVKPALEVLKTAQTDYSQVETSKEDSSEDVDY